MDFSTIEWSRLQPVGSGNVEFVNRTWFSGGSSHGGWSHVIQSLENPVRFMFPLLQSRTN